MVSLDQVKVYEKALLRDFALRSRMPGAGTASRDGRLAAGSVAI
jgi:hypothetical protein